MKDPMVRKGEYQYGRRVLGAAHNSKIAQNGDTKA